MLRTFNLHGHKFTVNITEATHSENWDFWSFYAGGQWEVTTVKEADHLLKADDLLFDIGAWVGPLTLWEAFRGVKVIAVEPDPVAYKLLRQHLILNPCKRIVTTVNKAVTDGASKFVTLNFRNTGGDAWSSILSREDLDGKVQVETITIKNLIILT